MIDVKFNPEYYDDILEGRKTQTMRIPPKRWEVEKGDMVCAEFPGREDKLLLTILDKGYKKFGNINDEDAQREGFENADELKKALQEIYKEHYKLLDYNWIYYYRFEVAGEISVVR